MAVLHTYKNKNGVYLQTSADGLRQTLQVNPKARKFLRRIGYREGNSIPNTLIRPLIAFGDIHTTHRESSKDLLTEMPHSGTLSQSESKKLRKYLHSRCREVGIRKEKLDTLNEVLDEDTTTNSITWRDKYEIEVSPDTSENPLSGIADKYFDGE